MKNTLSFKHLFLFIMLFALCNMIVLTCHGQLNSNVKSIRFRPAIDTATFTPHPVGTIAMHLDSLLYFYNKDSIWVPLIGGGSGSVLASNGLHLDGDTVKLGGALTENTTIQGDYIFSIISNSNYIANTPETMYIYSDTDNFGINADGPNSSASIDVLLDPSGGTATTLATVNSLAERTDITITNIPTDNSIKLRTKGIERLKIDSVGNVEMNNTNSFKVYTPDGNNYITLIDGSPYQINIGSGDDDFSKYSDNQINQNGILNTSIGGNFVVNTDVDSGTGVERLKIDSVGNINLGFQGNPTKSIETYAYRNSFNSNTIGGGETYINLDTSYFENATIKGGKQLSIIAYNGKDGTEPQLNIKTLGGNFYVNTDIDSGSGIERLKIDSVGYITNTGTNIQTFADVGTLGEPENVLSLDSPDTGESSIDLKVENETGGGISQSGVTITAGTNLLYLGIASATGNSVLGTTGTDMQVSSSDDLGLFGVTMQAGINGDLGGAGEYLGSNGSGGIVWGTPSDSRLKKDVTPLQKAYSKIMQLKPVNFTYIKGNEKSVGFIAQDVEKVLPEMVTTKRNGYKHLKNVTYLEPFIIATLQDMDRQIKALQKEVNKLKKNEPEKDGKHRPRYKH